MGVLHALRARPRLLGALVILGVVYLAAGIALTGPSIEQQMAQIEQRTRGMTADQLDEARARVAGITRVASPLGSLVVGVGSVFLVSGVLTLLTNAALGGRATYRGMTAAIAHTSLIAIPMWIVRAPLSIAQGTAEVALSPAALVSGDAPRGFVYHLLNQLDVFALWGLALNVAAVAVLGGIPTRRAAYGVIALWAVWAVAAAGLLGFLSGLGQS